jgi:caspase domain-containing protein
MWQAVAAKVHATEFAAWIVCAGCLVISPATATELKTTVDAATGVKVAIPVDLVGEPTTQQWGQNWKSPTQHLSIDTINFGRVSLQDRYEKIVNKRGRAVSKKYIDDQRFLVEGTDTPESSKRAGESLFHVEMHVRAGEVRGLSIVYSKSQARDLDPTVRAIVQSFEPFPKPVIASPDRSDERKIEERKIEERDRRIAELNKRLQERDAQIAQLTAKVRLLETQPNRSQREDELRSERDSLLQERSALQAQLGELRKEIGDAASARRDLLNKVADLQRRVEELTKAEPTGTRVALVIGNNKYRNLPSEKQLSRAVNDSRAVARTLKALGFRVTSGENLDRTQMMDTLKNFAKDIRPGDIALVYYAGHGHQIAGANYLMPSDILPTGAGQEARTRSMAIAESVIVAEIQGRARVAIVILDACRDPPLATRGGSPVTRGSTDNGFAPGPQAEGVFAIYSTGFGQAALESLGPNDKNCNSVFTRVFIAHLYRSHTTHLGEIMYDLKDDVAKEASKIAFTQYPAHYDETRGRIFLAAEAPQSGPPTGGGEECPASGG